MTDKNNQEKTDQHLQEMATNPPLKPLLLLIKEMRLKINDLEERVSRLEKHH